MNTARLLLVEDDIVSAHFLGEVLEALPAHVVRASTCAEAVAASCEDEFDLWLLDANLPDGSAEDLLARLRSQGGRRTVAIALTADPFPERRQRLLAAGFLEVLQKPLEARRLQAAARQHLRAGTEESPARTAHAVELWDDAKALHAAGGNPASVAALRALFAQELPLDRERVLAAFDEGRLEELQDVLHRLKASCGFVGARRLLDSVQQLSRAPTDPAHRDAFDAACRSTLAGL